MEAPKRIYLQAAMTEEDDDWDDEVGVTWCDERINDSDVEYVRRDVAVELRDHLGVICAVFSSFGLEMLPEIVEVFDKTAWLADSPKAPLSPDGENGEEEG